MKDTVREIEEQLEALGPEEQRSVERVDLLNELAWEVGFLDPARAHEAATEAAEIADELSYPRGQAWAKMNQAFRHYYVAEYETALQEGGRGTRYLRGDRRLGRSG